MTERELTESFREAIDKQETEEFPLMFMDIRHPSLGDVIRVVSNSENIMLNGHEYQAFQFNVDILTDSEKPPKAQFTVQNVDRKIGAALLNADQPPIIDITVYSSARFDETVIPHVPLDDPPQHEWRGRHLFLTETSIDGFSVTGTLRSWDYMQENYPDERATEAKCPALYW